MKVLQLSSTAVESMEVVIHEVSGETDAVFLSLSCDSKTAICPRLRVAAYSWDGIIT